MTSKKCYTLIEMVKSPIGNGFYNRDINIVMRNHVFERGSEEQEFSTCAKCGVVVNQEYIKFANEQTNGEWLNEKI